jgi:hypothetical protein
MLFFGFNCLQAAQCVTTDLNRYPDLKSKVFDVVKEVSGMRYCVLFSACEGHLLPTYPLSPPIHCFPPF